MTSSLRRLGRSCASHPGRVLGAWFLAAVALLVLGQAAGGTFINEFRVPDADSQRAVDLARAHLPQIGAASADIVLHREAGPLDEPASAAIVTALLDQIRSQPDVAAVGNPLLAEEATNAGGMLSEDGRTALTSVEYGRELGELTAQTTERLQDAASAARSAGIAVEFRGLVIDLAAEPQTSVAEFLGLAAALLVLLVAFGSVVAAGLPIVVALIGLVVGSTLVLLVSSAVDIPTAAPIVAVMLGLGAGIDYALFVVTTFREQLRAGRAPVDAAAVATGSAGHAVVFAGATVVVAILGLLFAGIPFIGGMGIAAALTVAVMVLAALTLLPALLGLLGPRVNSGRLALVRSGTAGRGQEGRGWLRWGRHLDRHRLVYGLGALLVMAAIAAPVLSLRLGTPDDGNSPPSWTQRKAYDQVEEAFGPGWNGPLLVVVSRPPASDSSLTGLGERLRLDPAVAVVAPAVSSPDGAVSLLTVVPRAAPQSAEVSGLVHRIRDTIGPAALSSAGSVAYVGGTTAFMIDLADAVAARLPWVIAAVVLAGALLLFLMFRAPLIAAKAALMALLSIAAAYGVLVVVFQWGWGLSWTGVDDPVPIMSIVPMLLFAVLFGLSMDYEVFLLSAVHEEYDIDGDSRRATAAGLARTGRVITAAAAIMAVVFLSFVGIDDTLVKMVGVGLATAVIVDATLLRVVLGPAVLSILGPVAWWPHTAAAPTIEQPGKEDDDGHTISRNGRP